MKNKMVVNPQPVPVMTASNKAVIIFTTFGLFGVMLASFFVFDLTELSNRKRSGNILLKNPSFELWKRGTPVGWKNNGAIVTIEDKHFIDGGLSVGINNESSMPRGISQKITLNPHESYIVRYSMKADADNEETAGVEINYTGENVEATVEAQEGIHFHDGGTKWRNYYGRVEGATSISFFFFTRNKIAAYVDGVGVSLEPMPEPAVY